MPYDKHCFGDFLRYSADAVFLFWFIRAQQRHIVCCYDSSYVGYPSTFVLALKEGFEILIHSKNPFLKKNICILLQK